VPRQLLGRYNIEITLDGEPVNWDHFQLEEYSMHESVKQKFPTAELSFTCTPYYVLVRPILDGTQIVVTLEDLQMDPPSPPQTYRMRAFNTNFRTESNQFKYYVSMYLDAQDLHVARSKSYGETTSSNAIAAAAVDAGLTPTVDPSADVQKWLRRNVKGADFIFDTSSHSYAGPFSTFVTGIGATHTLRHYNIDNHIGGMTGWVFKNMYERYYKPKENEILFEDVKYKTVSGTNNSYGGYGRTNGSFHLEKGFSSPSFDVAKAFSGAFQMAKSAMGSQRAQTMSYDSDNTHEKYQEASVQNLGGKALFSVMVELVTRFGRHPLLLDYVMLEPRATPLNDLTPEGILTPWAGAYFISEIHTMVTPGVVGKKFCLLRDGLNFEGATFGLVGEDVPPAPADDAPPPKPAAEITRA
jgi:hypothetical protein